MRAVVTTEAGSTDVLAVDTVSDPSPAPDEVLIEVAAAGVNRADVMQREGHYPPPSGVSEIIGLECSGRIRELGAEVDDLEVGDEVCALLPGGGYAELVTVSSSLVLPRPRGVDLVTAAALPETACTVWANVFMLAALRPTETLLVHGGTSGIGTMVIPLAKLLGARVITTAGSDEKVRRCQELGADLAINYRAQDFVQEVADATDGSGADVILDIIGASYLSRNVEALATEGRLVIIGLQGGRHGELDLGKLLSKRAGVLASGLRYRPVLEKAAIVRSVYEHVWPLIDDGQIVPVVDRVLPLDEVGTAHGVLEASEHVGKILLTP